MTRNLHNIIVLKLQSPPKLRP